MGKEIQAGRAMVEVALRDRISAGLNAMERRMSSFGRNVGTLGAALTAGSLGAIGWPLKLAADIEQTGIAFEVMVGDATKAQKLLKDMQQFAASTPFGFTDISESGKLLLGYGVAADDVMGTIKLLGDASQGNAEKLQRLTLAYGQVQAKGRLMGQEVMQMTENGFNPLKVMSIEMAKRFGGLADQYVPALTKKMEAGEISAGMLTQAFIAATSEGGRFHGMMEKQSTSALGLFSTMVDNANLALAEFGTVLLEAVKPGLEVAIQLTGAMRRFVAANAGAMKVVGVIAIGIGAIGVALAALGGAALAASTLVGAIATALSGLLAVIGAMFSPVGLIVALLVAGAVVAWQWRDAIYAAFTSFLEGMQPAINAIQAILGALVDGRWETAAGLAWTAFVAYAWTAADAIGGAVTAALNFLGAWIPGVNAVREYVVSMFAGIGQAVLAGRWDLAGQIMMAKLQVAIATGWEWISNTWSAMSTGIGVLWDQTVWGIRTSWHAASTALASGMVWVLGRISDGLTILVNMFDLIGTGARAAAIGIKELFTNGADASMAAQEKIMAEYRSRVADRAKGNAGWETGMQSAIADGARATQQSINADYERSLVTRGQGDLARRDANARNTADARARVGALEGDAAKAWQAAGAPTLAGQAEAARRDLANAVNAANKERSQGGAQGFNPGLPRIAAKTAETLKGVESRGTFTAAAAAMFSGVRSSDAQETASNTRQLVQIAKKQADKRGPQFT